MVSGIVKDLLRRRVPQILGIYLAIGWGVLEFLDWLIRRYALSPYIADFGLLAWASMIPTVLMLAYFHGERGEQRWTRIEKIAIPANLLAAVALLVFMFAGRGATVRAWTADGSINAAAVAALEPTRIAVLYFYDDSEGQDLGHLASAFTGALIDELTLVKALDVIPRGGVKPYRNGFVSLDSLARALKMGTLVEGSVSGSKERLVVSVTLIDPATQSSLDSFSLDGPVEDWLDLRDNLAKEVARLLRRRLGREIRLRERQAGARNAEALALVEEAGRLRGEATQLEEAGDTAAAARELTRADSLLARAESADPTWVEPIVLRGSVATQRAGLSSLPIPGDLIQEDVLRGLSHAERALALEPADAGALELRGTLRFAISQSPKLTEPAELRKGAEQDLRAAVAADPLRASAWVVLSDLHQSNAHFAEAKRDAERALEADPFLADASIVIWRLYESSQELMDMDESVRWCQEGHRRFPDEYSFVACYLFALALSEGPEPDMEMAWALQDTMLTLASPQEREQLRLVGETWVAAVLARAGHADSAVAVSERARASAGEGLEPWIDYYAANVRLLARQREESLALLSAFLEAVPQRKAYIASDWMFQDLWDDPRFKELVSSDEQ